MLLTTPDADHAFADHFILTLKNGKYIKRVKSKVISQVKSGSRIESRPGSAKVHLNLKKLIFEVLVRPRCSARNLSEVKAVA